MKAKSSDSRLIGYARVSTIEQNLDMQIRALIKAGVRTELVFVEKVSASSKSRPKLDWAIEQMREGDTLVVWKLDRIARSVVEMLRRIELLKAKGCDFISLTERIETGSPAGTLMMHMLAALAQFERDLVVQRTNEGIKAAKARGVLFGIPPKLDAKQIAQCRKWKREGRTVRDIVDLVKSEYKIRISQQTAWKYTRDKK